MGVKAKLVLAACVDSSESCMVFYYDRAGQLASPIAYVAVIMKEICCQSG